MKQVKIGEKIRKSSLDKSYFNPMLSHPLGILLMFVSIILYIVYILIIRKILKVDL